MKQYDFHLSHCFLLQRESPGPLRWISDHVLLTSAPAVVEKGKILSVVNVNALFLAKNTQPHA